MYLVSWSLLRNPFLLGSQVPSDGPFARGTMRDELPSIWTHRVSWATFKRLRNLAVSAVWRAKRGFLVSMSQSTNTFWKTYHRLSSSRTKIPSVRPAFRLNPLVCWTSMHLSTDRISPIAAVTCTSSVLFLLTTDNRRPKKLHLLWPWWHLSCVAQVLLPCSLQQAG